MDVVVLVVGKIVDGDEGGVGLYGGRVGAIGVYDLDHVLVGIGVVVPLHGEIRHVVVVKS